MKAIEELLHEYVLTPHGLRHGSMVSLGMPDGTEKPLLASRDQSEQGKSWRRIVEGDLFHLRSRGPAGWIESATFTPSVPLGSMCVKFKVPEPPLIAGKSLLYLFPGMEGPSMTTILQPVLQYGKVGVMAEGKNGEQCPMVIGKDDAWTLSCWHYVPDGHTRVSAQNPVVQHGQTLVATIGVTDLHTDSCDWKVEIKVEDDPEICAVLHAPRVKELFLFAVAGALEAYSLDPRTWIYDGQRIIVPPPTDPRLFPASGSTTFRLEDLEDLDHVHDPQRQKQYLKLNWNARKLTPDCEFQVCVADDKKSVTLMY